MINFDCFVYFRWVGGFVNDVMGYCFVICVYLVQQCGCVVMCVVFFVVSDCDDDCIIWWGVLYKIDGGCNKGCNIGFYVCCVVFLKKVFFDFGVKGVNGLIIWIVDGYNICMVIEVKVVVCVLLVLLGKQVWNIFMINMGVFEFCCGQFIF